MMLWRPYLAVLLAGLSSCSQQSRLQCIIGPTFKVLIRNNGYAKFAGDEFLICPSADGKTCDKHNKLKVYSPMQLAVAIVGDDVAVKQIGGSVTSFRTDPGGEADPDYLTSHAINLNFVKAREEYSRSWWVKTFVDGREVALKDCG